jgi:hypothetical protein
MLINLSAIGQLGVLILTLSGIQYNCLSEPAIPENGSHHRLAFARYLKAVKFHVLNILRLDHSFEKYIPVCNVVDKILDAGWLKTIRDVENYIITAAKVCSLGKGTTFNDTNDVSRAVRPSCSSGIPCICV